MIEILKIKYSKNSKQITVNKKERFMLPVQYTVDLYKSLAISLPSSSSLGTPEGLFEWLLDFCAEKTIVATRNQKKNPHMISK
jgi:hypothetical protein